MPTTLYADYGYCHKPMLHVDRTADHDILLFVLSGCMPIVEDGHEYLLKAGDVLFLKKGIHHWGKKRFTVGTSWFFIHFKHTPSPGDLPEISPDFRHTLNMHCLEDSYRCMITLPKHLHNLLNSNIEDKFRKVVELFNTDRPFLMAYVNTCLHELLVDLYVLKYTNEKTDNTSARIQRIFNFLSENFDKPFSPADLESYMGLSYKHIGKIFKEHTGMTLHECYSNMKMKRAMRLLCTTNMTISEISECLSYSDPLYFSNVIKKHTGMSPRTYRNKYSSFL